MSKTSGKNSAHAGASRRTVLASGVAAVVAGATATARAEEAAEIQTATEQQPATSLTFTELPHGLDAHHAVSPGHEVQVLIRWGDPVTPTAPVWSADSQSAAAQRQQFGFDNDFIAYQLLPYGSRVSNRGLLCVNHESARNNIMFPGFTRQMANDVPKELVDVEMAAVGHTVVEVLEISGTWSVDLKSRYNRRITATTPIMLAGPAAGHKRLQTREDPSGRTVLGTFGNCAGGQTPWGTVLSGEENIHEYFAGNPSGTAEARNHADMGVGAHRYSWHGHYDRFNVAREPNEPNRFGWIVEIDPYEPKQPPVKRTALGRFQHEGAGVVLNRDGRLVCYMGDDEVFQCIYKYVSREVFDPKNRARNARLLDDGILYVARFDTDNTLTWLPLVWGAGPLTEANGFAGQADVLIETRRAAKLLGGTPMDRPEDIDVHALTNTAFVALTKNSKRTDDQMDVVNPRAKNRHGHIIQLIPPGAPGADADHAALTFSWRPFLLAGNPKDAGTKASYNPAISENGWLSCPDNFAQDPKGRLWITTDGAESFGYADGLWATDVTGAGRALTRHFFRCPAGAELTGPAFTPDGTTLFCSVQHPGDVEGAAYATPGTRWPDFKDNVPPRPSVIAIRAKTGQPIG